MVIKEGSAVLVSKHGAVIVLCLGKKISAYFGSLMLTPIARNSFINEISSSYGLTAVTPRRPTKQCRNPEPPRTPTSLPRMDKYVPQTNVNNAYIYTNSFYTHPIFVNEILSLLISMVVYHYCIFPLTKVSNLKMAS